MGAPGAGKPVGKTMKANFAGLAKKQIAALDQLAGFTSTKGFYLAGGTALSLYFGHRKSVDLDWFSGEKIGDALLLAAQIKEAGIRFEIDTASAGTLHGTVNTIRLTFLEYRYPLLRPFEFVSSPHFKIASLDDLACMKLSAIAQRGARKDFCDIYALGTKHRPLSEMLKLYQKKFGVKDIAPVLYGLNYFDDAECERMPLMLWDVDWITIRKTIQNWLK